MPTGGGRVDVRGQRLDVRSQKLEVHAFRPLPSSLHPPAAHLPRAGTTHSGESKRGLFTNDETAMAFICAAASGLSRGSTCSAGRSSGASQAARAGGGRIAGMRSWIFSTSALGAVVMMVHERMSFPSGDFHVSHKPANANGRPSLSVRYMGT